jgi:hypothetical protein
MDITDALMRIAKRYEFFSIKQCKGFRLDERHYYRNAVAMIICRMKGWDAPEHRYAAVLCYGLRGFYFIDPDQNGKFSVNDSWFDDVTE